MLRVVEEAFRSDTGRQRTANEDSYYARAPMFVVADGMGGAQAGEVASRIAVESFEPAERGAESPETFLRAVTEAANERIHSLAEHDTSHSGMGTTLTAALVEGDEVSFAHVGDSRAYLYREGELRLLTSDHSLVEELRRQGRLTEEQAEEHPQRSIITRALGPEADVEVDTMTHSARPGDVYLLCSDGLTTMIKEERIAEVLAGVGDDLDAAVSRLVGEANDAGGRDNITVVAFRLADAAEVASEEDLTLVGPSAEEAGLSGATVRERAAASSTQQAAGRGRRGVAPPTRKPSRLRTGLKLLVASLIVAAVAVGAWLGARQIYFLGTDEGGRLALYRGLPYDLPLDISLYSEVHSSPTQVDSLPDDRRDEATNHELRGRDDATNLLEDLETTTPPTTPPTAPATPGAGDGADRPGSGGGEQQGGQRQGESRRRPSARGADGRRPREAGLTGRKSQGTPSGGDRTRGQKRPRSANQSNGSQ